MLTENRYSIWSVERKK